MRGKISVSTACANDHLVSSDAVITVILLLMSGMAMVTHLIGVHSVLGASSPACWSANRRS